MGCILSTAAAVSQWGVLLGVCFPGGVLRGVPPGVGGGIPEFTEADTPPVNRKTDRCKNITFATSLLTVKMVIIHWQIQGALGTHTPFPLGRLHLWGWSPLPRPTLRNSGSATVITTTWPNHYLITLFWIQKCAKVVLVTFTKLNNTNSKMCLPCCTGRN